MLRRVIYFSVLVVGTGLAMAGPSGSQANPPAPLAQRLHRLQDQPDLQAVPADEEPDQPAGKAGTGGVPRGEVLRLGEAAATDPLERLVRLRERLSEQEEEGDTIRLTSGGIWDAGRKLRAFGTRAAPKSDQPTLAPPKPGEAETDSADFGLSEVDDAQSSRRTSVPEPPAVSVPEQTPSLPRHAAPLPRQAAPLGAPEEFKPGSREPVPIGSGLQPPRSVMTQRAAQAEPGQVNTARRSQASLQEKLGALRQSALQPQTERYDLFDSAGNLRDEELEPDAEQQPAAPRGSATPQSPEPPVRSAVRPPAGAPKVDPAARSASPSEPEVANDDEPLLLDLEGPQLSASATGPRKIVVSRQAEYSVTIRNEGEVEANDVVVSVSLPTWVDVVETNPTSGSTRMAEKTDVSQPLQWRITRLGPRSTETLVLQIIPRKSHPLNLSVRWTYAHAGSQAQVEVEEPMLQMVISGPSEAVFGQTKLYNLTLSNPGSGDAENVVITLLPLGGKQESAATTNLGRIRQGETKTIQVELTAGKAGTLVVRAQAEADGGIRADASKEVLVRRASLKVEVEGPQAQYAGNAATFQLRVSNPGNASAEDVSVTVFLPEGAELLTGGEGNLWVRQQGRVRWDVGQLTAGQSQVKELMCVLNTAGENQVRVTAQDKTDLATSTSCIVNVVGRADLKLAVSDPDGPVPVGEVATYTLRIRNRGTKGAEGIEAVAFFSEGIEPLNVVGGEHELGRGQVVFKTIPHLAADGEIVFQIKARADRPGNHVFRAEVLCRSLGTKLAAEETTHFYGKDLVGPGKNEAGEPTIARPRTPAPIEAALPQE